MLAAGSVNGGRELCEGDDQVWRHHGALEQELEREARDALSGHSLRSTAPRRLEIQGKCLLYFSWAWHRVFWKDILQWWWVYIGVAREGRMNNNNNMFLTMSNSATEPSAVG